MITALQEGVDWRPKRPDLPDDQKTQDDFSDN